MGSVVEVVRIGIIRVRARLGRVQWDSGGAIAISSKPISSILAEMAIGRSGFGRNGFGRTCYWSKWLLTEVGLVEVGLAEMVKDEGRNKLYSLPSEQDWHPHPE